MIGNNDEKKKYASQEELTAAVKEAIYDMNGVEVSYLKYQTFAQVVIKAGKGTNVMPGNNVRNLAKIGGDFINVRYKKAEGMYMLFHFEKTEAGEEAAKIEWAEIQAQADKFRAERKADKAAARKAAKAAVSNEVA